MTPIGKFLRLYETSVLFKEEAATGPKQVSFSVQSGSRLVFTTYVAALDPGTVIRIKIKNSFDGDIPYATVMEFEAGATGHLHRVLTDVHNLFVVEAEIVGGNASFRMGLTIVDNAIATRIENAVIEAALSHIAGSDGRYDSIRVGDGIDLLQIRKAFGVADDGSLDINDIGYSNEARVKLRLCSSPDVKREFQFVDVDGVWRVSQIEFTSASLDANMAQTIKLTRTFTYETVDPFNLVRSEDNLTMT